MAAEFKTATLHAYSLTIVLLTDKFRMDERNLLGWNDFVVRSLTSEEGYCIKFELFVEQRPL